MTKKGKTSTFRLDDLTDEQIDSMSRFMGVKRSEAVRRSVAMAFQELQILRAKAGALIVALTEQYGADARIELVPPPEIGEAPTYDDLRPVVMVYVDGKATRPLRGSGQLSRKGDELLLYVADAKSDADDAHAPLLHVGTVPVPTPAHLRLSLTVGDLTPDMVALWTAPGVNA